MAGRPAVAASSRWLEGIRKWYYNAAGFNKLGLMRDDTIHVDNDVQEAIRRLPENLYNDRVFRIKRALDLSMRQQILPKEQWTKYEEVFASQAVFLHSLLPAQMKKCCSCDQPIEWLSGSQEGLCEANPCPSKYIETRQKINSTLNRI
uniref:Cytochrome b-c1 complex subunit 7 n=1 Tax=Molossus molossus TaxID=27622 RepID=A0A7J8DUV6_MOLMO|nr:ubiquinol-cytochrome c reductase binding protein [Molossus molossus]